MMNSCSNSHLFIEGYCFGVFPMFFLEHLHLKFQNVSEFRWQPRLMEVHFDEISHESVGQLDAWRVKGTLALVCYVPSGTQTWLAGK